jgi:hypothetical protein
VFTARYALIRYTKQTLFAFKGLRIIFIRICARVKSNHSDNILSRKFSLGVLAKVVYFDGTG